MLPVSLFFIFFSLNSPPSRLFDHRNFRSNISVSLPYKFCLYSDLLFFHLTNQTKYTDYTKCMNWKFPVITSRFSVFLFKENHFMFVFILCVPYLNLLFLLRMLTNVGCSRFANSRPATRLMPPQLVGHGSLIDKKIRIYTQSY